jgi:hypothetical protein
MTQKERLRIKVRNRQLKVLAYIRDQGKANTQQLIAHFKLAPSSISGIVGQLTKNGEITGMATGQRTKNGNTIMDYCLTEALTEQPKEASSEDEFPLLKIFPEWIPQVNFTGTKREHICKS